jgi:hypothetical protein
MIGEINRLRRIKTLRETNGPREIKTVDYIIISGLPPGYDCMKLKELAREHLGGVDLEWVRTLEQVPQTPGRAIGQAGGFAFKSSNDASMLYEKVALDPYLDGQHLSIHRFDISEPVPKLVKCLCAPGYPQGPAGWRFPKAVDIFPIDVNFPSSTFLLMQPHDKVSQLPAPLMYFEDFCPYPDYFRQLTDYPISFSRAYVESEEEQAASECLDALPQPVAHGPMTTPMSLSLADLMI